MTIHVCPFCGTKFHRPILDGIAKCSHCSRFVESTKYNKYLSMFRLMKSTLPLNLKQFRFDYRYDEDDIIFIHAFVENEYSFDEFEKALRNILN